MTEQVQKAQTTQTTIIGTLEKKTKTVNIPPTSTRFLVLKIAKYSLLAVSIVAVAALVTLIPLGFITTPILISALVATSVVGFAGFLAVKSNLSSLLSEFQKFSSRADVEANINRKVIADMQKHPENFAIYDATSALQEESNTTEKEATLWRLEQLFRPKTEREQGNLKNDTWEEIRDAEPYTSIDQIKVSDWNGTQNGKDFTRGLFQNIGYQDDKGNIHFFDFKTPRENNFPDEKYDELLKEFIKQAYPEDNEKQINAFLALFNSPFNGQSFFVDGILVRINKFDKSLDDQTRNLMMRFRYRASQSLIFQHDGSIKQTVAVADRIGKGEVNTNKGEWFTDDFFPALGMAEVTVKFNHGVKTLANAKWEVHKTVFPTPQFGDELIKKAKSSTEEIEQKK